MKFIFSCFLFSQLIFLVGCTTVNSSSGLFTRTPPKPSIPLHKQPALYNKYKNECLSLRTNFAEANWEVRALLIEWGTIAGSDKLSGRGRAMFARNYKASHKFTRIQRDSLKQMDKNKKEILSQLPSYDANFCETNELDIRYFP